VLGTCMLKPTWIVVSCDPELYEERPVGYGQMWSVALRGHQTARLACRAISLCTELFVYILICVVRSACHLPKLGML